MAGKQPLSSADCDKMMQADLAKARGCVSRLYGNGVTCACARNVLVDMCYNMGQEKLEKYSEMNKAIKEMNNGVKKETETTWKQIADEAEKTTWCKNNSDRCTLIKTCDN